MLEFKKVKWYAFHVEQRRIVFAVASAMSFIKIVRASVTKLWDHCQNGGRNKGMNAVKYIMSTIPTVPQLGLILVYVSNL